MSDQLVHRGPDDGGVWCERSAMIGFSHRRLSIIDLSPAGHQPMTSASGRFTITFNGEIYNYRKLRDELAGYAFKGNSDTEVLLAGFEKWGIRATLERAIGMFALGVWDSHDRTLLLARDRFGEKPLYYGVFGGTMVFGSELKALRAHPAWVGKIDRSSLALFFQHDFVPAPHCIYENVSKVVPGGTVAFAVSGGQFKISSSRYYDPKQAVQKGLNAPLTIPDDEIARAVSSAIENAISRQMVADVPVGAFLSGGIDSSLVVSLMQRLSPRPVKTFSIGFTEKEFNEAPFAAAVAQHLGTEHTELIVTPMDALDVVPRLASIFDEPFADSSQIPTYLVARMAKQHVTVSLSGDAGDELFAGYARYPEAISRYEALRHYPGPLRRLAGSAASRIPLPVLDAALLNVASPWRHRIDISDRVRERSLVNSSKTFEEYYHLLRCHFKSSRTLVRGANLRRTIPDDSDAWPSGMDHLQHMMFVDMCHYMPDDILVKVDRSAMAVSLETRVPLLDPDVVALAWSIPSATHRKDGRGKWVLRRILAQHVPTELIDRPKKGFSVPVARWLRSELREWAENLLRRDRLDAEGLLDAGLIRRLWAQHLAGGTDWSYHLWNVLMFQAWLDQNVMRKAA